MTINYQDAINKRFALNERLDSISETLERLRHADEAEAVRDVMSAYHSFVDDLLNQYEHQPEKRTVAIQDRFIDDGLATSERFGSLVRSARIKAGLLQADVVKVCETTPAEISRLELGRLAFIKSKTLKRLEELFGLELNKFVHADTFGTGKHRIK